MHGSPAPEDPEELMQTSPAAEGRKKRLQNVAHRGYSAIAPENTLPALAAAGPAGATLVEFDVRTTADGVPVVIHDRTVDRTTNGTGAVGDLTVDELRALDAGSWFSPAYAGMRVPLLAEVLDLLAGSRLLVEIKPPATLEQVKVILAQIADRGLLGRTVVQSFDPDVLRLARDAVPDLARGLLRLRIGTDTVVLARELDVAYCNLPVADVLGDVATVAALTEAGVAILPWTANDMGRWPELIRAGVAGMISDRTGELTGWLAH
jgi:glycerophosphoryl diester phosphodiesterase